MKYLDNLGKNARKAFRKLNNVDSKKVNKVLENYSGAILSNKNLILKENNKDVKNANPVLKVIYLKTFKNVK